jgi:poly-gamma-glutamate synthesis protein (capsule biosynthesis protein)
MCHSVQYNYAQTGKDSFDFKPVYREVKKYLENSDLTLGNLETVVAGGKSKLSGYPLFNSPEEYLLALQAAGFDLLFTSNNHSMDRGKRGVLNTLSNIRKYGMKSVGTYASAAARDSVMLIDIKGIRFAFLSYTFGTNGIPLPKGEEYLVNRIDTALIRKDIEAARSQKSDIVFVYFHFGEEYSRKPSNYQKNIARITADFGADIIIASHPHVVQGFEKYSSGKSRFDSTFIAYSLGNFISNQRWRYSDGGLLLNLEISKYFEKDSLAILSIDPVPTWVFKGDAGMGNEYIIIPLRGEEDCSLPFMKSDSDKSACRSSYHDQMEIIGKKKSEYLLSK